MVIFKKILKTKSDPNIHQNAPNCTIFKKFLVKACPEPPITKRMASQCAEATCKFRNLKKKFLAIPLPNPGYAPGWCNFTIHSVYINAKHVLWHTHSNADGRRIVKQLEELDNYVILNENQHATTKMTRPLTLQFCILV